MYYHYTIYLLLFLNQMFLSDYLGGFMEKIFGDSPQVRIISFLLDHPQVAVNKTKIIQGANVGRNTLYKKLENLIQEDIVIEIGEGRSTLYQLNSNHPVIRSLLKLKGEGHL
jgi:predicted transcriptional regulator